MAISVHILDMYYTFGRRSFQKADHPRGCGEHLITLGKPPLAKNKSLIKSILLVDAEGRKAAVGEIADYGHADTVQPPAGYVQPGYEKQYQKRAAWFAVKNLYEADCRDGQVIGYKTTEGQAVPDYFIG